MKKTFLTAALATLLAMPAWAQPKAPGTDYPNRPVRVVVALAPGGNADINARLISTALSQQLGQQFVVENRPSGGGTVAFETVAQTPPDGYTLLVGNVAPVAINGSLYKSLDYDAVRDFAPVTMVAAGPNIVVVNQSVSVKSIKELVAYVKGGGKMDFGTSGAGTISHLAAEMFKNMTGTSMLHVPYKGSALIINDLLGGQIQISFSDMPVALPHVKAGKLRALAVTGPKSTPLVPGVPSVAEAGVPGYAIDSWWGVLVPTGTPKDITAKLNTELVRILNLQDVKDRFAGLGVEAVPGTQAQFAQFITSETAKFAKLIKDVGVKIE
jgi:tripartite-type tricarboxylate transporter receptor subunit TctC